MKRTALTINSAIIFMIINFGSSAYAQDWPQWLGPSRNAKVTGFKAPASWPAELKLDWKVTVGTGDASPSLAGNKIYLSTRQGNDEVILCLDAATGKELWKTAYSAPAVTGPATSHPGPRSTPSVTGS
jgi:outer membrane protein assembly factor BamB